MVRIKSYNLNYRFYIDLLQYMPYIIGGGDGLLIKHDGTSFVFGFILYWLLDFIFYFVIGAFGNRSLLYY